MNRLAEIRDGALALLGGADKAVADGADDLVPGKADHARRGRIDVDDPMRCGIDDEDPRVDRVKEGLQVLLLAGRHIFRTPGCLLDLDPHANRSVPMMLEAGVSRGLHFLPPPAGTVRHCGNRQDGAHLTAKEAMHEAYQ